MPKKIKFESFRYRFLVAAQDFAAIAPADRERWRQLLLSLQFAYEGTHARISWEGEHAGSLSLPLGDADFYTRGDSERQAVRQREAGMMEGEDPVKRKNDAYFREAVGRLAAGAGFAAGEAHPAADESRLAKERAFHDAWAGSEDLDGIDVRAAGEACTAPEMRFISRRLGNIAGKRLLDIGCGLGEASVYFALKGARVTSSDLSQGMLDATCRLASLYGVEVQPHLASAEEMGLPPDAKFDIIYAGNLLHHVDIDQTLARISPHVAPDGLVVTWDPLAYNPAINAYRTMATEVRTEDEHPLKWSDIQLFRKHFKVVETNYFWLTTLAIFVIMAIVQRRNPNKERFWKVVVQEGDKWRRLYEPLEALDRVLLKVLPPLRLLCWNVVVVARGARA